MERNITDLLAETGFLTEQQLKEQSRWGVVASDIVVQEPASPDSIVEAVREAIELDGHQMRESDLDIMQRYIRTLKPLMLHLEGDDTSADVEVLVGTTLQNGYILPWRGETIQQLLCNSSTYLNTPAGRAYFRDFREVYTGRAVTFLVSDDYTVVPEGGDAA